MTPIHESPAWAEGFCSHCFDHGMQPEQTALLLAAAERRHRLVDGGSYAQGFFKQAQMLTETASNPVYTGAHVAGGAVAGGLLGGLTGKAMGSGLGMLLASRKIRGARNLVKGVGRILGTAGTGAGALAGGTAGLIVGQRKTDFRPHEKLYISPMFTVPGGQVAGASATGTAYPGAAASRYFGPGTRVNPNSQFVQSAQQVAGLEKRLADLNAEIGANTAKASPGDVARNLFLKDQAQLVERELNNARVTYGSLYGQGQRELGRTLRSLDSTIAGHAGAKSDIDQKLLAHADLYQRTSGEQAYRPSNWPAVLWSWLNGSRDQMRQYLAHSDQSTARMSELQRLRDQLSTLPYAAR